MTHKTIYKILTLNVLLFILTSCSYFKLEQESQITVSNAWAWSLPPHSKIMAIYLKIENKGSIDDELISVQSTISKKTEIHQTIMIDDQFKMNQLNSVIIPKNSSITFKPASYHIMLRELLVSYPKTLEMVPLILHFKSKGQVNISARIKQQ